MDKQDNFFSDQGFLSAHQIWVEDMNRGLLWRCYVNTQGSIWLKTTFLASSVGHSCQAPSVSPEEESSPSLESRMTSSTSILSSIPHMESDTLIFTAHHTSSNPFLPHITSFRGHLSSHTGPMSPMSPTGVLSPAVCRTLSSAELPLPGARHSGKLVPAAVQLQYSSTMQYSSRL